LPQIIGVLLADIELVNKSLRQYDTKRGGGGMEQMMHDMTYAQGMFSRRNMDAHQKRLDAIGAGANQFLGTYSPFLRTVGQGVGRQMNLDPMGYGEDIIIRFADTRGSLYIVKEDEHMRVMVDKRLTRWDDNNHEVRTMVIYEYDDEGVEQAVADFARFAPGFENHIKNSRIVYVHRGYVPSVWKSYLFEINFQDNQGRQRHHYRYERAGYPEGNSIRRESWDSAILEAIAVMKLPDDSMLKKVRERFGPRVRRQRDDDNSD
jgi:hypothetical protein